MLLNSISVHVNFNPHGGNYGDAAPAALSGGHRETVKVLDKGPRVKIQCGCYYNDLQAASSENTITLSNYS